MEGRGEVGRGGCWTVGRSVSEKLFICLLSRMQYNNRDYWCYKIIFVKILMIITVIIVLFIWDIISVSTFIFITIIAVIIIIITFTFILIMIILIAIYNKSAVIM